MTGGNRIDFAALGMRVILPPGATRTESEDAPGVSLPGPKRPGDGGPATMAFPVALLPELARLGWYGVRWEPIEVRPEPAPAPIAAAPRHVDPYTAERIGGPSKTRRRREPEPVGSGQGMLF